MLNKDMNKKLREIEISIARKRDFIMNRYIIEEIAKAKEECGGNWAGMKFWLMVISGIRVGE